MSLQQAKKIKVGDKVIVKNTGKVITVSDILYDTNTILFEDKITGKIYRHREMWLVN